MSPDLAMKIATVTVIVVGLILPPVVVFGILRWRLGPGWRPWAGGALALAGGFFLVFGKLFPDTFRQPAGPGATVEVILPDRYRGFVYLYFDSRQAPLQPVAPRLYSLLVPPSGKLRAGQFPGQSVSEGNTTLVFRYLNGDRVPIAEGSLAGGGQSRDGWSVAYYRPFVGSAADHQAARRDKEVKGTLFDEPSVLDTMVREARSGKPPEPASLDGLRTGVDGR